MNKAFVLGRLGDDPKIKAIQGGCLCSFPLATTEVVGQKDGGRQERTEWHRIVAFGKLAEICGKHLTKGSQVLVEGKLQTTSWDDAGQKKYATQIVAAEVKFLSTKKKVDDVAY